MKAQTAAPPDDYCSLGLQTAHIGGNVRFTKLTTCDVWSCWDICVMAQVFVPELPPGPMSVQMYGIVQKEGIPRKQNLRRETRKVDQSEGRQGEDSQEGAVDIVALFAR